MLIRLVAPGQPVSAKNHKRAFVLPTRIGQTPRAVVTNSKAIKKWYAKQIPLLQQQFAAMGIPTINCHVHVETHQYLRDEVMANASPDGDGAMSGCWDALQNAGVIMNDKLITSWGGTRQRDTARPRVEIEIRLVDAPG